MGEDGVAELSADAARLAVTIWPFPVIEFYLGRRSLDDMRAAAGKAGEKCESAFYAGEWELLRSNRAEARELLQDATDTCPKTYHEYAGALSELKRLSQ
jgi:hypothetical protein